MTEISIDTPNPTGVSVDANVLFSRGGRHATSKRGWSSVVCSSMLTAATPTLTFAPDVSSTLSLTGGVWSAGNTTYTATYDVADANVLKTGVTVEDRKSVV